MLCCDAQLWDVIVLLETMRWLLIVIFGKVSSTSSSSSVTGSGNSRIVEKILILLHCIFLIIYIYSYVVYANFVIFIHTIYIHGTWGIKYLYRYNYILLANILYIVFIDMERMECRCCDREQCDYWPGDHLRWRADRCWGGDSPRLCAVLWGGDRGRGYSEGVHSGSQTGCWWRAGMYVAVVNVFVVFI